MESGCWNHKKVIEKKCQLENMAEVLDLLERNSPVDAYPMMIFPNNRIKKSLEMKEKFNYNRLFQKATEPPRGKIG